MILWSQLKYVSQATGIYFRMTLVGLTTRPVTMLAESDSHQLTGSEGKTMSKHRLDPSSDTCVLSLKQKFRIFTRLNY